MITDDKVNEINCLSDDFAVFFRRKSKNIGINAEKEKRDPIIAIRSLCHFVAGPRLELGTS